MTKLQGAEFLRGLRDFLPLLPGVLPFALILGAVASAAGMPTMLGHSMSYIVFAGSAQFIIAQLIGAGTPALVLVLTGAVVNLRHMLYSATLAPHMQHLPGRWKAILSYMLTDEAFAVSIAKFQDPAQHSTAHWHLLGSGFGLWSCWQICTLIGFVIGGAIPASWQLDFTLPVTFIALVFPTLQDRPTLVAALVGGAVAVMCAALPYKIGLLVAAFAGIAAGMLAQRGTRKVGQ